MAANTTAEVPTFKLVLVGDGGTGTFTTTTICSFLSFSLSLFLSFLFFFFFLCLACVEEKRDSFSRFFARYDHSWGLKRPTTHFHF
jgi:hypothetical protein